jgi:polyferredoxin
MDGGRDCVDRKINKLYKGDIALIVAFIIFLWVVMISVIVFVVKVIPAENQVLVATTGSVTLVFATIILFALIVHLRKNKEHTYTEEILNSERMAAEKKCK